MAMRSRLDRLLKFFPKTSTVPASKGNKPRMERKKHGFAGAGPACDAEDFAAHDIEVEVLEDDLPPETLCQAAHADRIIALAAVRG